MVGCRMDELLWVWVGLSYEVEFYMHVVNPLRGRDHMVLSCQCFADLSIQSLDTIPPLCVTDNLDLLLLRD